jgi:soluble lytic murein transglycosylase
MTESMIWRRIHLAITKNNVKLARNLAHQLNDVDRKMVELWIRVNDNPSLVNKMHYFTNNHSAVTEILAHGISKISSQDPQQALELWRDLSLKYNFNKRHQGIVLREIALSMANNREPEALNLLAEVPAEFATDRIYDLRLRLALLYGKWRSKSSNSRINGNIGMLERKIILARQGWLIVYSKALPEKLIIMVS